MKKSRASRVLLIAAIVSAACAVRLVLPNAHVHGDPGFWLAAFVLVGALPVTLVAGSVVLTRWVRERRSREAST